MFRRLTAERPKRLGVMGALVAAGVLAAGAGGAFAGNDHKSAPPVVHQKFQARAAQAGSPYPGDGTSTQTPIKHVVVIYQENVSFDHYFATYPYASNPRYEPKFEAAKDTPSVNGLGPALLTPNNPNSTQPFRLDRTQSETCDQSHDYTAEQKAYDHGVMDLFPESTGTGGPGCVDYGYGTGLVMGYYDGNTTTALWNYAQHFSMSDNSYSTTFGPSSPGAVNLVSGQTHGATVYQNVAPDTTPGTSTNVENSTLISDARPYYDDCASTYHGVVSLSGRNVGDLLNQRGITWGWFQGGFAPTSTVNGQAVCGASHIGADGNQKGDYIPHHEPFQYYKSTSNPHHLPPSSASMIGKTDQANHQYDLSSFWTAVNNGNMPAVSFLKAAGYQDGHAGYSSPLLEQQFITDTINKLQQRPEWKNTAVVIAYDDSDGWYDHQLSPIVNQSQAPADALTANGQCGTKAPMGGYKDRCGYGPRQPLLVISPWARQNYVDHSTTDQSSILQAIEDNWGLSRIGDNSFDQKAGSLINMFDFSQSGGNAPTLALDPNSGEPTGGAYGSGHAKKAGKVRRARVHARRARH